MTIAAGIVTYFTNDNDCHATNSCPNECKYCTYGEMGDLELKINEFEQNGFSLTIPNPELDASMLAAELDVERHSWMLSGKPETNAYRGVYNRTAVKACTIRSEYTYDRMDCKIFCESTADVTHPFGGMCYYEGFRSPAEVTHDASNDAYRQSSLEIGITLAMLACYGTFTILVLYKSVLMYRREAHRTAGNVDPALVEEFESLDEATKTKAAKTAAVTIFDRMDVNKDHNVSIDELVSAIASLQRFTHASLNLQEIKSALAKIDEDHSGEIDLNEFLAWMTSDNELAKLTLKSLQDMADSNVVADASEMTAQTEYKLSDTLRLHFIKEVQEYQSVDKAAVTTGGDERIEYVLHR